MSTDTSTRESGQTESATLASRADPPDETHIPDTLAAVAFLFAEELPTQLYERLTNADPHLRTRIARLVALRREHQT